jgi:cadmium resistance protein CadD (predicted permease)
MADFIGLIGIGITAFIASNIDDTFILIILFMTPGLSARNVTVGQFLGIIILVAVSSLAVLLSLAIPPFAIGFLGIIPIVIGVKRLLEYRENEAEAYAQKGYLSFLSVAAVTVSYGGDDIGVFTPLFAKYNGIVEFSLLISLLMIMTGIWCIVTYYFLRHPFIASRINALSKIVTPFALISIGIYIILDSIYL